MHDEQKECLSIYVKKGQLNVVDAVNNSSLNLPKSLSLADVSVISLANSLNGVVLTSDKLLRLHAQKQSIEVHGFLWLIQRMIRTSNIDVKNAQVILEAMTADPFVFRNNELLKEVQNTIQAISKL
jgi:predicted nucleic acid-binding protein